MAGLRLGWLGLLMGLAGQGVASALPPGDIFTVAGAGYYAGDGGSALQSSLYAPHGLAVDAAGEIFIADTSNNVIRKISGGIITTVAGNGSSGYSGDGGDALQAELKAPQGVCVDGSGNIYIADTGNFLVRKVSNGTISTIAGVLGEQYLSGGGRSGNYPALSTPLVSDYSVAVDSNGYVYSDGCEVVRGSNLDILPVGFGGLQTLGPDGSLYLASDYRIYKITNPLGAYSESIIAGNGTFGYTGDNGPATSAEILVNGLAVDASGNVFLTENYAGNYQVVREVSGGNITTIAGGTGTYGPFAGEGGPATAAHLASVCELAVAGGKVYISDQDAIRSFPVGSNITTLAGNRYSGDGGMAAKAGLNGTQGVAADRFGNVYISDTRNYVIRKVDSLGVIQTYAGNGSKGYAGDGLSTPLQASFFYLNGLAVDSKGGLLISDGQRIRRISSAGMVTTVAGTGTYGHSGDGGSALAAEIQPVGSSLAVDADDNIYFPESGSVIRMVTSGGLITTVAGTGTAGFSGDGGPAIQAQLNSPNGVALSPNGDLYIAEPFYRVRKVSHLGSLISTLAGNGTMGHAPDGVTVSASVAVFGNPGPLACDQRGNLYVGDSIYHQVRMIDPNGVISTSAGNGTDGFAGDGGPGPLAELSDPWALATDPSGNLLIADLIGNRVREVVASNATLSLPKDSTAGFHVYHGVLRIGDSQPMEVAGNFLQAGRADIVVYNSAAKVVRHLYGQTVSAGQQVSESWDGTDDAGKPVASGTYAISFRWNGGSAVKRVAVVR